MLNIEQRFRIADGAGSLPPAARPSPRTLSPLPSASTLFAVAIALGLLASWLSALADL